MSPLLRQTARFKDPQPHVDFDAGTAIDANVGICIQLFGAVEIFVRRAGVGAVDRTDLQSQVFRHAGIGNHVRHRFPLVFTLQPATARIGTGLRNLAPSATSNIYDPSLYTETNSSIIRPL
jgi:hypothetical protein